jgi:hypothetical protein
MDFNGGFVNEFHGIQKSPAGRGFLTGVVGLEEKQT